MTDMGNAALGTDSTVVVIGASLAGAKAAETLRDSGYVGRLVLVGEEQHRPYERPPLSKAVLQGKAEPDVAYVHGEDWYDDHGVELRLGTRATGINVATHEIELDIGERLGYDRLLLTTGSSPKRLPISGGNLEGVHYLRRMEDSLRLRDRLVAGVRVVVVGAGWIGLETAAAARERGAQVTIVEPLPTPLHAVLGPELGAAFGDLHRDHGVDLRLETGVEEFRGDARVSSVLAGGQELPADVVIVGVGIRPNVELAESAGLEVDNGILVDEALRTSAPDVYAAGDVANSYNPLLGQRVRVEHWANALHGGPAAARSMLGEEVVYDPVPYFFSDQYDLGMEYAGWAPPGAYDEVRIRGDRGSREFISFWLKGGRIVAGMNVNVWDVTDDIQALIRSGAEVDRERLTDLSVPLGSLS